MKDDPPPPPADEELRATAFVAVSTAFASLGRYCMALDASFRVRHATERLDQLLGQGASTEVRGLPAAALLGEELFGAAGSLRQALAAGERREGWRGTLRLGAGRTRLVSVTAAPLMHDDTGVCDPEATYLVVMRPAEEEPEGDSAPLSYGGLVARSPAMARVFRLVESLSQSDATVLLSGESGTGKEVVARALHSGSRRREGPFVAVNCGALPPDLLESELFGHVRGAFTGAVRDREGRFEAAQDGTLFLDEIGDLPLVLQVKLLRVLQERTFERVGETRSRESTARIIAATHVDLRRAIADGRFREDLYYRLRVVPIDLPPLRERREDVEPLARHLLARVGARNGRAIRFSPDALRTILAYAWPGNVRELENALEYAVAVCKGQTLLPEDLPAEVSGGEPAPPPSPASRRPAAGKREPASEGAGEAARLRAVLEEHRWSRARAAQALGMSRTTLWRKMRELGLAH